MEWILICCRGAFQECWALGRQEWLIRAIVRKIAPASSLDEEVDEDEEEEGPKGYPLERTMLLKGFGEPLKLLCRDKKSL